MNTKQLTPKRAIRLALAAMLAIMILAPASALAVTAAGTQITNTATVVWSGNATGVSDSATVTVELLPANPALTFVSTNPAAASDNTQGVGSLTPVDVLYSALSGATGFDTYTLAWSSSDTGVGLPNLNPGGVNTFSIELGGSMILSVSGSIVTIPGKIGDHGLEVGDTIDIGGTSYSITGSVDNANTIDTDITLNAPPAVTATGTPIYEEKEFTLQMVAGSLIAASGTHELTLTADFDTGDATAASSVAEPTIYVIGATLAITKSANLPSGTSQTGDTIEYSILVSNPNVVGAANAANVVITDPIPAFTDFANNVTNGGCTVEYSDTASAPYAWVAYPGAIADANVTAIKFDCGNLAIGASVTVGFDVVIE